MPSYELKYSEPIVRAAARSYVLAQIDWRFVLTITLVVAALMYGLVTGDRSMTFGFVLAAFAILAFVLVYVFFAFQVRASKLLRKLNGGSVGLDVSDVSVRFLASTGSYEIPSGKIKALRRFDGYAILFYSGGGYSTLPLESLGDDGLACISQLVSRSGGKVA